MKMETEAQADAQWSDELRPFAWAVTSLVWNWTSWKSEFRPFSLNRMQSSNYQNESQILSTASAIGGNIALAICQPRGSFELSCFKIADPRSTFCWTQLTSSSELSEVLTCLLLLYLLSAILLLLSSEKHAAHRRRHQLSEKQSKLKSKRVSRTLPLSLDGGQGGGVKMPEHRSKIMFGEKYENQSSLGLITIKSTI